VLTSEAGGVLHVDLDAGGEDVVCEEESRVNADECPTTESPADSDQCTDGLCLYAVSQKNNPDIDSNLKKDYQILVIFGKSIPDTADQLDKLSARVTEIWTKCALCALL